MRATSRRLLNQNFLPPLYNDEFLIYTLNHLYTKKINMNNGTLLINYTREINNGRKTNLRLASS